ncbi:flagellar hook-length control protein FliK [Bdellovibrio sp. NC01]|nr:flagellar hook-length control protein FliK [Bdellovibrio sp. NC01]
MVGATDLKSTLEKAKEQNFKGSGTESSFGKTLQDKLATTPKEVKDNPKQEMSAKDSKDSKDPQEKESTNRKATDEKPEQKVAKPDGTLKKKSANRQQAIKEFMDSFESEFEIPPTRLVEAMAKLDDSQLKESPETTADAVIEQLGLDDAQADKARAMYASMLMQLQQTPQQKPAPEMMAGASMSQQGMQMRVAAAQQKQDLMGSAVDNLNKKFWMTQDTKVAQTAMPDLSGDLMQNITMDDSADPTAALDMMDSSEMDIEAPQAQPAMPQAPQAKLPELPPHLQGQMQDAMSPALLAALAAKKAAAAQASAENASEETPELKDEFSQALAAPKAEKPLLGPNANNVVQSKDAMKDFMQQQQNQSQGDSLMKDAKDFFQQSAGDKESAKTKLTTKSAEFKSTMTGLEGLQAPPIKGESLKFDPMAPMAPVAPQQMGKAENEAAVKQLMNQAQYLIKNGGGEVKVEMTPEGMGTIHLKVMLQDGKVNMQMSADTQEAKKTIESSLAELKTSLAAHKLSVENVKIDVVNTASTDNSAQNNQQNMNGQNQHREARQFWNQFNDNFGNQGRREALADFQNIKGYGGKGRDPLQPLETSSTKTAARAVSGKGSGLNLVA